MASTTFSGPVRSANRETDGQVFIPGYQFMFDSGTWTQTRIAAGDWSMRKTAADTTNIAVVNLSQFLPKKIGSDPNLGGNKPGPTTQDDGTARVRGYRVTSILLVYGIGTAAMDAHTYDIVRTTYANNVANATDATVGGTLSGTLATATQANPYVTTITVGTPFIVGNNVTRVDEWFELTDNTAATTVYDLYGMFVNFDYNLL